MHFQIGSSLARRRDWLRAVDGVSFSVRLGETLALVGESGSGKSTTARAILQLYRPTSGEVLFEGVDLTGLRGAKLRAVRRRLQIVFQDPYSSVNSRMTIAGILSEPLDIHGLARGREREAKLQSLLEMVGLERSALQRYPHEFSGGQRQRIGIARALALEPTLLIADEPVSALDISIRAQVLNLLKDLQDRLGLTYLFISHDLGVVRHVADRVAVMYLGRIIELGRSDRIFSSPLHPYTQALLSAVPIPDPLLERTRKRIILFGEVSSSLSPPKGCRFNPRCGYAQDICRQVEPQLVSATSEQSVACHFWPEIQREHAGATPHAAMVGGPSRFQS